MKEQQKTRAERALDVLDQAWAYYTPETRKPCETPVYEDLPIAA